MKLIIFCLQIYCRIPPFLAAIAAMAVASVSLSATPSR
jgi:hypothetical protein